MDVSVVIATKDRAAYVERALAALRAQSGAPPFEAIVVDNGSADDTREVVERAAALDGPAVRYVYEGEPNRGKARNRGAALAAGSLLVFCDDDVWLPPGWIAAHAAAHRAGKARVVNGPILNVPSYDARPKPAAANYSRAFLCTCNASLPRAAFERVGGFDENFPLYGWEDTELGTRLRQSGLGWGFAWDAYLWHIKTQADNTLEVETRKAAERARMARRFLELHPSRRARMATGAHAFNLMRGRYLVPDALLALYAGVATEPRVPAWLRAAARGAFLDGTYVRELARALSR
ncbi:MAG TPA: glycosyltransferase family A protein [Verrucomicrobiae bacterium]|nr:glycosyltransferase family A protein [Verrucomicrobiae bacterium]